MTRKVVLKEGREASVRRRHPWIFSGAIQAFPEAVYPGEILPLHAATGDFLGIGYFHPQNSLAGRLLSFTGAPIEEVLRLKIQQAVALRMQLFNSSTTAYRLINAEGDGIPGLIVDRYADLLVLQCTTWGIERLKSFFVQELIQAVQPFFNLTGIYEKSNSASRLQEGLETSEKVLWGEVPPLIEVLEMGMRFSVSLPQGQKTGLFLDQREMRGYIEKIARGKRVLNCFSYTGGFSLFALRGGAKQVTSVDSCFKALQLAERNMELNGFEKTEHRIVCEDVFNFLERESLEYDLFILDPPAFAKKQGDVANATKGYRRLHQRVFQKAPPRSELLTFSCSYYIEEKLFQSLIFQAALETGRNVKIIGRHLLAADHPVSLYHPEGSYLKGFHLLIS